MNNKPIGGCSSETQSHLTDMNIIIKIHSNAKKHYRSNIFFCTVDLVICRLTRCFESWHEICNLFGILWNFEDLTDKQIKAVAQKLQQKYAKEVSHEICDELAFIKKIYRTFIQNQLQQICCRTFGN
jgi:hypothetical protein